MSAAPFLDGECLELIGASGGCLVAVSGGADSVALLQALHAWAAKLDPRPRLEVLHVHHQLRGAEADEDARFVEDMCRSLGSPFHLRRTAPPSERPGGTTLEEFLRAERHACFDEVLATTGLAVLALGHTADDLAETFLLHLMRGAGPRGLAFSSTEVHAQGTWVRPLWKTSRAEILAWMSRHQIGHREDSTNLSAEFTRNRVRWVLLPLLEREFNPSVRQALLRSAALFAGAEDFIRAAATEHLAALQTETGDPRALPIAGLLAQHSYLQSEIVAEWVRGETENEVRPSAAQLDAILRRARRQEGRLDLSGSVCVASTRDRLVILATGRTPSRGKDVQRQLALRHLEQDPSLPLAQLPPDGLRADLSAASGTFSFQIPLLDGTTRAFQLGCLPAADDAPCPPSLLLRNRRSGDRLSPSVKLKDVLINDKVPPAVRDFLILAATPEGQLLHILGLDRLNARLSRLYAA